MVEMFKSLCGDITSNNEELILVLASIFFLFVLTEIFRFLEMFFDHVFRRKK